MNQRLSRNFFSAGWPRLSKINGGLAEFFFGRRPAANSAAYRTTVHTCNSNKKSRKLQVGEHVPKSTPRKVAMQFLSEVGERVPKSTPRKVAMQFLSEVQRSLPMQSSNAEGLVTQELKVVEGYNSVKYLFTDLK